MPRAQALSYVIPARNAGVTLHGTLASLAAIRGADWSALIVDDNSTDDTRRIAARAAEADHRIRVIACPGRGVADARQAGFDALAHREHPVCFLDADDLVEPSHAWRLLESLRSPEVGAVACGYSLIDPDGARIGDPHTINARDLSRRALLDSGRPLIGCFAACPQILSRVIDRFGSLFNPSVRCEDWDFWLRLDAVGVRWAEPIAEHLVAYRVGQQSRSADIQRRYHDVLQTITTWEPDHDRATNCARLWTIRFLAQAIVRNDQGFADQLRDGLGVLATHERPAIVSALQWAFAVEPGPRTHDPIPLARELAPLVEAPCELATRAMMVDTCWSRVAEHVGASIDPGALGGGPGRRGRRAQRAPAH